LRNLVVCTATGVALGILLPNIGARLQPVGTAFIDAIKMVVIPLIFTALTLGVWKMGAHLGKIGRIAAVAMGWFLLASLVSMGIAVGLNELFHPGIGAGLQSTGRLPIDRVVAVDWAKFFLDLIPSNVLAAMANQEVLPTVVFAVLFGLALAQCGDRARPLVNILESLLDAMFVLIRWIVSLAPIAVFGIMAWLSATQGTHTLVALGKLVATLYLGFFLLWAFFWLALVCIGENPIGMTRKVLAPVLLGFTTRSSEATFPLHMATLEAIGAPTEVVSVVLPLGYSFNLDGAALYQVLAVTFLADAYGIPLTATTLFTILLTTFVASKGLANVPAAALVALATVVHAIGLPLEALAVIMGVDVFIDMGRTATNVYGNTIATILATRFSGFEEKALQNYEGRDGGYYEEGRKSFLG
jgi:dicarboxylate/amino acid:cation (Na+ or H+) symporter, DAACS family